MNTKVVRIKEEEKTRETLEKNPGLLEAAEILKNGGLVGPGNINTVFPILITTPFSNLQICACQVIFFLQAALWHL